jgi:hypothetical protein
VSRLAFRRCAERSAHDLRGLRSEHIAALGRVRLMRLFDGCSPITPDGATQLLTQPPDDSVDDIIHGLRDMALAVSICLDKERAHTE